MIKKYCLIFVFLISTLSADSMFMLTKIPKAYLVVENYVPKLQPDIKEELLEELKITADELGIDTSGYSHRTFGIILYETVIESQMVLNIDLVLGEQVSRLDDKEEVYGLTYEKRKQFFTGKLDEDELREKTVDSVYLLLNEFSNQYKEDNL